MKVRRLLAFLVCTTACGGPVASLGTVDATDAGLPWSDGAPTHDGGTPATDAGVRDAATQDGAGPLDGPPIVLGQRPSPLAAENRLPGSTDWRIQASADGRVAGYAEATSYLPGEAVAIHAAAQTAAMVQWSLWRLGYYGGAGGRRISDGTASLPAATPPTMDATTGAVTAGWPVAFTVKLPTDATTGVYLVKLSSATLGESYVQFVVREAAPAAPLVIQIAVNTYEAYNAWGGTSLYDNRRSDWSHSHAFAVSFDRPYQQDDGAGDLMELDRWLVYFAESQGWDVGYVTDVDVDHDGHLLDGRAGLFVQGHSEYWSAAMRDHVEAAIAHKTSVAFLGANDVYWQVRYAPSPWGGGRDRLLVGYKEFASLDPAMANDPAHVTTRWRDTPVNRPENALIGTMFGSWQMVDAPFVVAGATSWLWAGTGAREGDVIPGLFWGESDRRFANGAEPSGLVALGASLVETHDGVLEEAAATLYTAPSGAAVFSAATWGWSVALSAPGRWDARVQGATANLVDHFLGRPSTGTMPLVTDGDPAAPVWQTGAQVATVTTQLPSPVTAIAALPTGGAVVAAGDNLYSVTATGSTTLLAGGGTGDADGPAASARFHAPRALAVASDGTIYIADSANNKVRALSKGVVRTVAGNGMAGFADGACLQGQLNLPLGLALLPDGTLVIADNWNMRLRAVAPGGKQLVTWAGNGAEASVDGPGAQASLYFPMALAARPDGTLLFVEAEDGLIRQVKDDSAHTVSSFAGNIGATYSVDGDLSMAQVGETTALAVRPATGDVLLLDSTAWSLRAIHGGQVVTLVGAGRAAEVDGDGRTASLWAPIGVSIGGDGAAWIADAGGHAVRLVTLP